MNLELKAQAFVTALVAAQLPRFEDGSPKQARALVRALLPQREPRAILDIADHRASANGDVASVRLYRPQESIPGCILYLHGGGWVLGDLEGLDGFARELAFTTGWAVAAVDYRLAPEHPFPAGLDDADVALRWLADAAPHLFGRLIPIVVLGDSAGGNLAAALALRARDRGTPPIAGQVLAYPVTDAGMDTDSYRTFAEGPVLTAPLMAWFWSHYIGDEDRRGDPAASPLRAASLSGLPPAFVLTAQNDPLRDEGEAYAAALAAAAVPVRRKRYDGQIHGFVTMVGMFDGGAEALGDISAFLGDLQPSTTERDHHGF